MKKLLFLLFCFLLPSLLFAQGEGNVWMLDGVGLDFNSGEPVLIESGSYPEIFSSIEGTASICDEYGDILFYTNGENVFNREHTTMPDGEYFTPLFCNSTTQAATIIQVPGSDSLFFLFSLGITSDYAGLNHLRYSLVDMSLDGGLGNIVTSFGSVFVNDSFGEKMSIVGDCENIWVVVCKTLENELHAYPVTSEGVGAPVISSIASVSDSYSWAHGGELRFSEDGSKAALANFQSPFLVTANFSLETGVFSEPQILIGDAEGFLYLYTTAFSPDGTKLYVPNESGLTQFDLSYESIDDIVASKTIVSDGDYIYAWSSLKLGPNGKMYLKTYNEISVINAPNLGGIACNFEFGIFYPESEFSYFEGNLPNAILRTNYEVSDTIITSSRDTTICPEMALIGRAGASSYEWNDGSSLSSLTIDTTGVYYVTSVKTCATYVDTFHVEVGEIHAPVISLRDTVLCEKATSIRLSATIDSGMATTYHWEPASAIISGGDDSVVWVNPMAASVFYLTATNHSGICDRSATDSLTISFFNNTVAIVSPDDTTICSGDDITIVGSLPAGHTAHWSPEASVHNPHVSATVFSGDESTTVVFTSSMGHCSASDTLNITVQPTPVVNVGNDTMICDYDRIKLNPNIVPATFPGYEFSWSSADLVDDAAIRNPVFSSTADSGFLKLTVATPAGCTGSDSLYWKVRTSDFMMLSSDTGMCPPVAISLLAENATSYLWMPADGLSSDTVSNPTAYPVATTNYLVMGTSRFGCVDTQYVLVEVYPEATVHLQDSAIIYPGESFQINPEGNAVYYSWFPPSGLSASNIANPIASPEVRTRYFYTATTEMGCWLKDSIDILVSTESVMDMPNAFVPGNGTNNVFKLSMRGIAKLNSFTVFNRWGNKVFDTKNIAEGWDGTFNGTPQPMGVYMYIIDAVSGTGKPFVKQGNVTLIR